jgi:hypothetical protein
VDTSVTAAIGLNGWYGNYYGQDAASSPLADVRPDAPPFFIAHGDHDTVAPVEVARHFANSLGSVSTNPVVYAELPGAQHAFDLFGSLRFELVVDTIEAFTAWVRSSATRQTTISGWSTSSSPPWSWPPLPEVLASEAKEGCRRRGSNPVPGYFVVPRSKR